MAEQDIFKPIGDSGMCGADLSGHVFHQIGLAREHGRDVSLQEVENELQMWLTRQHRAVPREALHAACERVYHHYLRAEKMRKRAHFAADPDAIRLHW